MFTDWTQTDPHYFYVRGVIFGCVLSAYVWGVLIPFLKRKFK